MLALGNELILSPFVDTADNVLIAIMVNLPAPLSCLDEGLCVCVAKSVDFICYGHF